MTLTKLKPGKSLLTDTFFPSGFSALFNDMLEENSTPTNRFLTPKAEVIEDDKKFQINVMMAGLNKEDIKLDVKENELVVSGEQKKEEVKEEGHYHLREFRSGSFRRSFYLPEIVDMSKTDAEFKNGVLMIQIPKKEKAQAKVISIK